MSFQDQLKDIRTRQGLTQRELAEKAGVSASAVSSYENLGKIPPLDIALKLADALNVHIGELCARPAPEHAQFATYADFAKAFLAMERHFAGVIVGMREQEYGDPPVYDCEISNYQERDPKTGKEYMRAPLWGEFSVRSDRMAKFLSGWFKLRGLLNEGTIDAEVYQAWMDKQLAEMAKIPASSASAVAGEPHESKM